MTAARASSHTVALAPKRIPTASEEERKMVSYNHAIYRRVGKKRKDNLSFKSTCNYDSYASLKPKHMEVCQILVPQTDVVNNHSDKTHVSVKNRSKRD